MRKLAILFCFGITIFGIAQTSGIDSLKRLLNSAKPDTSGVINLNELAWQYVDYSTDSSNKYLQKALHLAQQINYLDGVIDSKNTLGILFRYAGESEKAIRLYQEIIDLRTKQNRFDKLTSAYSNLGSVYFEKGDNANALTYYLKAYDNATKLKQTDSQMMLLNNMGSAYKTSGLFDLALDAFKKGLQLNKTLNDDYQEALFYSNIATVYDEMKLYQESVNYTKQAYAIFKRTNNIRQLSFAVNNLGIATRHMNDFKATDFYLKEMKTIADALNEDNYYMMYHQLHANFLNDTRQFSEALKAIDQAISFGDSTTNATATGVNFLIKGNILINKKECLKGMQNYDRGIFLVRDDDDKQHLAYAYKGKSEAYSCLGDYKLALRFFELSAQIFDSLNTQTYTSKIATLNALNNLDKKEKALLLSIKEKETAQAKTKQQSQFLIAACTIGLLVVILLVFSIRAYLVKKKDNTLLNSQKTEIELKNNTLNLQKIEIQNQMYLIEEKHKEITDSINYAERIQRSLLASKKMLDKNLTSKNSPDRDYFILFKPKDIVSGDFYWAASTKGTATNNNKEQFILVTADSTGHGVPGAIMSILNISCLDKAFTKGTTRPDLLLNETRGLIIDYLKNDGSDEGGKDGMDGSLLSFDFHENGKFSDACTLHCALANNPVWIVRTSAGSTTKELIEIKADRMPIGKHEKDSTPFTLHTFVLQKGDVVYTSTDGFVDQFGGEKGKKFKQKQLQELLMSISDEKMATQRQKLNDVFVTWKGHLEQVDDVCLIGVRI